MSKLKLTLGPFLSACVACLMVIAAIIYGNQPPDAETSSLSFSSGIGIGMSGADGTVFRVRNYRGPGGPRPSVNPIGPEVPRSEGPNGLQ